MIDAGNDSVFSVWKSYVCFSQHLKSAGKKWQQNKKEVITSKKQKKWEKQLNIRFTAVDRVIWAVEFLLSFTDGTIKCRVAILSEREAAHSKLN